MSLAKEPGAVFHSQTLTSLRNGENEKDRKGDEEETLNCNVRTAYM